MLDQESQSIRDILLAEGACTEEQLAEVAEEYERSGKPFKEILVDYGLVSEDDILQKIADNLGTELVALNKFDIEKNIIDMIEPDMARMYGVVPVEFDGETLKVVLRNPLDYKIVEDLQFILGYSVMVLIAPDAQVENAIEKYYPTDVGSVHDMLEQMDIGGNEEGTEDDEDADVERANEAPVVRFVDVILYQAIKDKASDVHFEPFEKEFRIRYRVDGALHEVAQPPRNLAVPVISRIKIMSNLNISERRMPQDGRIQRKVDGKPIDLRVSCLPTSYGESVVLRILDRSVVNLDLDALGIGQDVLAKMRDIIHMPNGILLVTGPTGSGKTTTLYSALKEVNSMEDKLLTAEDPVEYDIEGLIQVPVNDAVGMTFLKALRAFLRQDPDRIMIGELRDFESAQMAIQASLTGHFVFSTLHTNSASGTVTRLVDMGVQPFLIISSVRAILSQRLVRRVCKNCMTPYTPTDEELETLNLSRDALGDSKLYYGKGCSTCNETGYKGRKSICELLVLTSKLSQLISDGAPTEEIEAEACKEGMRTIRQDGIRSILTGETTFEEVIKYT